MKQLIKVLVTTIALAMAIVTHARETVSFTSEDLELLKQLACEENSDHFELAPSLPEAIAIDSLALSKTQRRSAYTEAVQIQPDPERETKVKEFCAELN